MKGDVGTTTKPSRRGCRDRERRARDPDRSPVRRRPSPEARRAACAVALPASWSPAPAARSDHAATYGKYLIETTVGHVVASVGPSVASILRRAPLEPRRRAFIAAPQSGAKPRRLLRVTQAARDAGAFVVGFVNDEASPWRPRSGHQCFAYFALRFVAPSGVSPATNKSHVLAALAFLQLVARTGRGATRCAATRSSSPSEFSPAGTLARLVAGTFASRRSDEHVRAGTGIGLGAALEMALKLKETCGLHAEGLSGAGALSTDLSPWFAKGFPVIVFGIADDASAEHARHAVRRLLALSATVRSRAGGSRRRAASCRRAGTRRESVL